MSRPTGILGFFTDERGSESVEFGIVAFMVAAATIHLRQRLRAALNERMSLALEEIESAE